MKRSILTIILSMSLLTFVGMTASAHNKCNEDWKQKMLSEKIAFLTVELEITPEEAQAFWPVYNQVNEERDKAMHQVIKAYKALSKAIDDNLSVKEIDRLLDEYLQAQDNQRKTDSAAAGKYKKVLPAEKVAKLYVGEEKFRRQHIRKLHKGDGKPGEGK